MKKMRRILSAWLLVVCVVLSTVTVFAVSPKVSLPTVFTDHMVLQRDTAVAVFGYCDTDDVTVTVSLGGQSKAAVSSGGKWRVTLDAMEAQTGLTMTVGADGGNTVTVRDIAIGEVWLCGGQSNMQFELHKVNQSKTDPELYTEEVEDYQSVYQPTLGTKDIRSFNMPRGRGGSIAPCNTADTLDQIEGKWHCSGDSDFSANVSAIGYITAYEMAQHLGDVTIGLLNLNNGDTELEVWVSEEVLKNNPDCSEKLQAYQDAKEYVKTEEFQNRTDKYQYWKSVPTSFYNRLIAPFQPYTLKGCLWYQGCNNKDRPTQYAQLFSDMVDSWREGFENTDMPFITFQLAPFTEAKHREIREAQFEAAETLENVYLVSTAYEGYTYTKGDQATNAIHPWRKSPVAKRAAHTALNCVYGDTSMGEEYSHPIPTVFEAVGNRAVLHFDHVGDGLTVDTTTFADLTGFEVSADGIEFFDATAVIGEDNASVILSSADVGDISYIRYGYNRTGYGAVVEYTDKSAKNATSGIAPIPNVLRTTLGGNLTNSTGYPTPAFRLDSTHKSGISVGLYGKKMPDNNTAVNGDKLLRVNGTYYKSLGTRIPTVTYTDGLLGSMEANDAPDTDGDAYIVDFATASGTTDTDNHGKVAARNWQTAGHGQWAFRPGNVTWKEKDKGSGDVSVISFDIYFEAMYGNNALVFKTFFAESNNDWNTIADIGFTNNTIYAGSGTSKKEQDFPLNEWHTVTMVFDFANAEYSVALDGKVFASDLDFGGTAGVEGILCVQFDPCASTADTTKKIYMDNVKTYRYKKISAEEAEGDIGDSVQGIGGEYDTYTARVSTASGFARNNIWALAALYSDDVLEQVTLSQTTLSAGTSTDLQFRIPDKDKKYRLKMFYWDRNTLQPVQSAGVLDSAK